ncbi:MAG: GatB/YqeY domain-containing protein [Candidatus Binataceae bacterium]
MKEKLQNDLKAAMKAGDKLRMMTLRGIISELSRVEKEVRRSPNESEIVQVIKRERARRDEALEFARKAAREDLIAQNLAEAKILDEYLPAIADADAVKAVIAEKIAAGVNQIGPLMKALRDQFGAQLDGKIASDLVKQALAAKT